MKVKQFATIAILMLPLVILVSAAQASGIPNDQPITAAPLAETHATTCHMIGERRTERLNELYKRGLFVFFEPSCLSSERTTVALRVAISGGLPTVSKVSSSDATESDIFYCTQAIWEAQPLSRQFEGLDTTCEFNKEQKNGHQLSDDLISIVPHDMVKLHLIPRSVINRFPGIISETEILSKGNGLLLRTKELNSSELDEFRKRWVSFLQTHNRLTRSELERYASETRLKYSHLFE